jgi:hypothetical protein
VSSDAELVLNACFAAGATCALGYSHRIWPVAGLGFAAIVNVAWLGLLGFEFFKLIEFAFF